jgi:hypothetical protein
MNLEGNSYSNINNDHLNSINPLKDLKSPVNVDPIKEKCFSAPIMDLYSGDKKLQNCFPVDPEMFKDFFGVDRDVEQARNLVKGIVKSSGKGELADKVTEFNKIVNRMDKNELVQTAKFIGEQMRKTDGHDDILGSLLSGVLNELNSRENCSELNFVEITDVLSPAIKPTICIYPKPPFEVIKEVPIIKPFLKY